MKRICLTLPFLPVGAQAGHPLAVPHAVQVADRFYLLKNLGDVVSRVFRQHAEVLALVPLEWRYEDVRHFRRAFVCGMSSIVQADYNTAQLPEAKMAS
jgi:hypothetical protein